MQCPDCGAYYSEEDEFCGECGRRLSVETSGDIEAVPTWAAGPGSAEELAGDRLQPPRPVPPAPVTKPSKKTNLLPIVIVGGVAALMLCLCVVGVLVWFVVQEESTAIPPTASNMLEPGALLYEESFDDPDSGWSVFADDETAADYKDGGYQITINEPNYMAWGNPEELPLDLGDMMIEVDVRQVEGPLDNNFGVFVRYLEGDEQYSYYWFQISADGYYSVDLKWQGEWNALVGWEESAAIYTGLGITNRIKVVCSGGQFNFYVNDVHLVDVYDGTIGRGSIGLAAGAFDEPGVVVRFDDVRVYELGE